MELVSVSCELVAAVVAEVVIVAGVRESLACISEASAESECCYHTLSDSGAFDTFQLRQAVVAIAQFEA